MLVWRLIPKVPWSQKPTGGQWRCPLARFSWAPLILMLPILAASSPAALARSAGTHRRRAGMHFSLMPLREQPRAHSTPGKSHHEPRVPFTCHGSDEGSRSDGGPAAASAGRPHGRRYSTKVCFVLTSRPQQLDLVVLRARRRKLTGWPQR